MPSRQTFKRLFCPQHAFKHCGYAGLLLGAPLAIVLTLQCGLSLWIEAIVIVVAVGTLLATPLAVKVLTDRDGFVFYREVILVFLAVTLALRWLHQPVLAYLDITIAGAGLFHACGRIGCLLAGCCYGRPAGLGIRYTGNYADMGFPSQLIGVRLFPVQVAESIWIVCITACASWMILRHSSPGLAFAGYVGAYAMGRFFLEFARGDVDRPYFAGFSQPQWISLLLSLCVSVSERAGVPRHPFWLSASLLILTFSMLGISLMRKFGNTGRFDLLHPRHTEEIAKLVRRVHGTGIRESDVTIGKTSLGICISVDEIVHDGIIIRHYCLSKAGEPLSRKGISLLARLISLLQHDGAACRLVSGSSGVTHLLF